MKHIYIGVLELSNQTD